MDRYANRLVTGLSGQFEDVQVSVAGNIDALTEDRRGHVGTESLDPAMGRRIPTSGFRELRRYVARYVSYPRRVRRMSFSFFPAFCPYRGSRPTNCPHIVCPRVR